MAETISGRYTFANTNLDTRKLKFLSGLQTNLNSMISDGGAIEGAFYLTTDTHRLYIGRTITKDGSTSVNKTIPIPVNEGITTVADTTALYNAHANVGEFYYIEDGNILAVRAKSGSGTGAEYWVQLNNDTDQTIEVITGTAFSAGTYDSTNHKTTYNLTIKQDKIDRKSNNTTHLTDLVIPLEITDAQIQQAISVGFGSTAVSNNSTTLSVSGNGAASSGNSVTLKGAGSVVLSGGNGSDITITGRQYTLGKKSNENTTVQLLEDTTDKGNIKFSVKANTENLAVDGSTTGQINYYHTGAGAAVKKSGTQDVDYAGDNTAGTVALGSSFKVPKISRDANGHIVSIEDVSLSLPNASAYTIKGINADSTGQITVTMNNNNTVDSDANNPTGKTGVLFHTLTVDGTASTVYNQGDLGSFYSASKVDEKIADATKSLDAMSYKGTVGSTNSTIGSSTLPSSSVSIGDTYLADTDGNMTGYTYASGEVGKKGDLYIATAKGSAVEDEDGYLPSNGIQWTHVAAGENDTTYTYKGSTGSNPTAQLDDSHNSTKGKVTFVGGDHISVNGALVQNKTDEWTFTVDHTAAETAVTTKTPGVSTGTASATLTNGGKFSIPGFAIDAKGHVTSTSDTILALPTIADYNLNYNTSSSASSSNRETKIHLWKGTTDAGVIAFETDNKLSIGTTANGLKISHGKLDSIPVTTNASTAIPSGGMTVVTGVGYDDWGHVTSYETSTFTVPTALGYNLLEGTYDTTHVSWKVQDTGNSDHGVIDLASSSLTFGRTAAGSFTADIVWGSFDS